ncbi:hypothetical protein ACIBIZ_13450 [Nonomuraea spiralis]|uniref:hypothetical protein n=1 Tax=Nonomuraea spiralis TaxID=46182 RepID=UPI0037B5571E
MGKTVAAMTGLVLAVLSWPPPTWADASVAADGGMLSGEQKVTFHEFRPGKGSLDEIPMSCGIPGSALDLSRITAVQGLTASECGTILKVVNPTRPDIPPQYVMAVDRGGRGLDLNTDTFKALNGGSLSEGLVPAKWEPVSSSFGEGILLDDRFAGELPGLASRE